MDWQKVRVQEVSSDIPAGSMPRSIDIIMRGDIVDTAKPGDRSIFTGTLVVVPDIIQLMKPGQRAESSKMDLAKMARSEQKPMDGVGGLKETGIRDLSYKMVFIASYVCTADSRFGFNNQQNQQGDEEDQEEVKVSSLSRAE
jgi:DNA replication licensing factor MCM6